MFALDGRKLIACDAQVLSSLEPYYVEDGVGFVDLNRSFAKMLEVFHLPCQKAAGSHCLGCLTRTVLLLELNVAGLFSSQRLTTKLLLGSGVCVPLLCKSEVFCTFECITCLYDIQQWVNLLSCTERTFNETLTTNHCKPSLSAEPLSWSAPKLPRERHEAQPCND